MFFQQGNEKGQRDVFLLLPSDMLCKLNYIYIVLLYVPFSLNCLSKSDQKSLLK